MLLGAVSKAGLKPALKFIHYVTPSTMLDHLEKTGLIEHRPNPHARRGTLIVIKKEAVEEVGPLFESARKAQDKIISSYSERELELLSEFLRRSATMREEESEVASAAVKRRAYRLAT